MDPKLALLFALVAAIIALSHLTEENVSRMRRRFAERQWRGFMPGRFKN
jgi:hypothetical protein